MMKTLSLTAVAAAALLAACATAEDDGPQGMEAIGDPARAVPVAGETVVTTDPEVDADDPALWADPRDPSRAVMFGSDKTDGLYVHNLDGSVRQFLPSGQLNNVDLRTGFQVNGREMVLVGATNDTPGGAGISFYLFDPDTLQTVDYGLVPIGMDEPYGFCMGRRGDDFYAVVTTKLGTTHQWPVSAGPDGPVLGDERVLTLGSQLEGCVVDDEADTLYVGEEDVALWRYDFDPAGSTQAAEIARVDYERIKDDIEGVTLMRDGGQSYLIVSSQGDSTFPVYRIEGDEHVYLGRFAVVDTGDVDGIQGTDGLDAWSGPIGGFPNGLLAIHDDQEDSGPNQQNYKFVDWREVRRALNF